MLQVLALGRRKWRRSAAGAVIVSASPIVATVSVASTVIGVIVEMAIVGLLNRVVLKQGVDLLRTHTLVVRQEQCLGRRGHTFGNQQRVDSKITGIVPAVFLAMRAPGKVGQATMQGLVGKRELHLGQTQARDVFGVVVQLARIGCDGRAPGRVRDFKRQS